MPPLAQLQQRRPTVLLIDDDPISREVLSMLLEMHGYPIACAENGHEALASIAIDAPEVILMDTQMPGLSGLDLIRTLRATTQATIVAISGSEPGPAIRAATGGFLLKPIQPEDLDALLAASSGPSLQRDTAGIQLPESQQEPVIDPVVLAKLTALMPPPAVREIYAAVATDLATRLDTLAAAMDSGNAAQVANLAHTTKGGCSMVGLIAATAAAARLEASNRSGTWPEDLAQLQDALSSLQRILSGEFPS